MKDERAEMPATPHEPPEPLDPLDHAAVVAGGLVEGYHRGALSAEDEERFEAHFLECPACQEELEVERSFVRGLKTVAAEDAARSAVGLGLLAWLSRRSAGLAWAVAVIAMVAGALGFAQLWRQNQRLETRVAELSTGTGDVGAPLVGIPVALLGAVRGDGGAPPVVNRGGGPYSLAVDAGADPRFTSYAVTILDEVGEIRFERHGLQPNDLEVIQLTVPAGFLPPGDHRLVLRGTRPDGTFAELGAHPFQVAAGP